jgi:drug/metabolite transporter (DMT)-like permease
MGRRTRKRGEPVAAAPAPAASRRRGRPSFDERPKAPWHPVPLAELCALVGLVLLVLGVLDLDSDRGKALLLAGMALGSLSGLDTAAREHFAGFRSHTTVLSALPAVVVAVALYFARVPWPAVVIAAVAAFAGVFWLLRRAFARRVRRPRR